jgi:hypothetical protein
METWIDNGDGTVSFETYELGTLTLGSEYVPGTYLEEIERPDIRDDNHPYHEYQEINMLGIPVGAINPTDLYTALAAYPTPFGQDFAGPGYVTHQFIGDSRIENFTT